MKMIQWWTIGDHPGDKSTEIPLEERAAGMVSFLTEGQVVGFIASDSHEICKVCSQPIRNHGEIDGTLIHPGDFVSVAKGKGGYVVEHPDAMAAAQAQLDAGQK